MSTVLRVEQVSKRYTIHHRQERAWRLVPRFRYYGQDYGLTALHARVSQALQEAV